MPRLPAFSWSMDYFNTIYIEQTGLGVGFHNLMNNLKPLTFRIKMFQLLSMKSQLNMKVRVHRDSFPKGKQLKEFNCLIITDSRLQLKFPLHAFLSAQLIYTVKYNGSDNLSFLSMQNRFQY